MWTIIVLDKWLMKIKLVKNKQWALAPRMHYANSCTHCKLALAQQEQYTFKVSLQSPWISCSKGTRYIIEYMVYKLINNWLDCLKLSSNVCYGSVLGAYWFKQYHRGEFKVEDENYKERTQLNLRPTHCGTIQPWNRRPWEATDSPGWLSG